MSENAPITDCVNTLDVIAETKFRKRIKAQEYFMLNAQHNHHKNRPTLWPLIRGKIKLETLFEELAYTVNENHLGVRRAENDALQHARQAGEALIAAKKALGVGLSREERKRLREWYCDDPFLQSFGWSGPSKGIWERWLKKYFRGSPETARTYMRIARNWDGPVILKARVNGLQISTISEFMKLIRMKSVKKEVTKDIRQQWIDDILSSVQLELYAADHSDLEIIEIIRRQFQPLWEGLWRKAETIRESAEDGPALSDKEEREIRNFFRNSRELHRFDEDEDTA